MIMLMVTTILTNSNRNQFLNFYFRNTFNKYTLSHKESYKSFTGSSVGHHSIVALCLCPHWTYRLQTPGISFHRTLKNYEYVEETNLLKCQPGWTIRHCQVAGWSAEAHAKAAINYNLLSRLSERGSLSHNLCTIFNFLFISSHTVFCLLVLQRKESGKHTNQPKPNYAYRPCFLNLWT